MKALPMATRDLPENIYTCGYMVDAAKTLAKIDGKPYLVTRFPRPLGPRYGFSFWPEAEYIERAVRGDRTVTEAHGMPFYTVLPSGRLISHEVRA